MTFFLENLYLYVINMLTVEIFSAPVNYCIVTIYYNDYEVHERLYWNYRYCELHYFIQGYHTFTMGISSQKITDGIAYGEVLM